MGASLVYLEKPNTEIAFESGENEKLKFAAGEMQGWRLNMVSCSATTQAISPGGPPPIQLSVLPFKSQDMS